MLTEWQSAIDRNDRQRINSARQAAEDLFKPRQETTRADVPASAPNAAPSTEHQPRRQPRIFMIPSPVPMSATKVEVRAEPKPLRRTPVIGHETHEIPASQFGRVRALTSYGMTGAQVAELYGVTIDKIEQIIRRKS